MKIKLPQIYFSKVLRAIVEFDMLSDNDNIMVGLSGGKDSLFLTYMLAVLRERLSVSFNIQAVTIDPLFTNNFPAARLKKFCSSLDIPFTLRLVDIAGTIEKQNGKDPCFTCSFFRRAAVNRFAQEQGCNKVAYAHHHDDAVETFFMSLLYSGQLKTFSPVTYLDRTNITVIRPLIYLRESELRDAVPLHGCTPLESPCPLDGHTTRQTTKELIADLGKNNPQLYEHLAAAMRQKNKMELWPPAKNRAEMLPAYQRYMYGSKKS